MNRKILKYVCGILTVSVITMESAMNVSAATGAITAFGSYSGGFDYNAASVVNPPAVVLDYVDMCPYGYHEQFEINQSFSEAREGGFFAPLTAAYNLPGGYDAYNQAYGLTCYTAPFPFGHKYKLVYNLDGYDLIFQQYDGGYSYEQKWDVLCNEQLFMTVPKPGQIISPHRFMTNLSGRDLKFISFKYKDEAESGTVDGGDVVGYIGNDINSRPFREPDYRADGIKLGTWKVAKTETDISEPNTVNVFMYAANTSPQSGDIEDIVTDEGRRFRIGITIKSNDSFTMCHRTMHVHYYLSSNSISENEADRIDRVDDGMQYSFVQFVGNGGGSEGDDDIMVASWEVMHEPTQEDPVLGLKMKEEAVKHTDEHSSWSDYKSDKAGHWKECSIDGYRSQTEQHSWGSEWVKESDTQTESVMSVECTECGYKHYNRYIRPELAANETDLYDILSKGTGDSATGLNIPVNRNSVIVVPKNAYRKYYMMEDYDHLTADEEPDENSSDKGHCIIPLLYYDIQDAEDRFDKISDYNPEDQYNKDGMTQKKTCFLTQSASDGSDLKEFLYLKKGGKLPLDTAFQNFIDIKYHNKYFGNTEAAPIVQAKYDEMKEKQWVITGYKILGTGIVLQIAPTDEEFKPSPAPVPTPDPDPVTVPEEKLYAISVKEGAAATIDGKTVFSAEEGETVNISYKGTYDKSDKVTFEQWDISGAEAADPKNPQTTFVMGKSPVQVRYSVKVSEDSRKEELPADADTSTKVSRLAFESKALKLKVGETGKNEARAVMKGGTAPAVQYVTGNADIVAVSPDGTFIAMGAGRTKVTAYSGNKSAVCNVTVVNHTTDIAVMTAGNVNVTGQTLSMKAGEQTALHVSILPGDTSDPRAVKWTSSNKAVTVKNGMITVKEIKAETEAEITAMVKSTDPSTGKSKPLYKKVTIKALPVKTEAVQNGASGHHKLALKKKTVKLTTQKGSNTFDLAVTLTPKKGADVDKCTIDAQSSNESIVKVNKVNRDKAGSAAVSIEAVKPGTAYIMVKSLDPGDKSRVNCRRCKVIVTSPVESVTVTGDSLGLLDKGTITIREGMYDDLTAVIGPEFSTDAGKGLKWKAGGGITVKDGLLYAKKATSSGKVTVKCGKKSATVNVIVVKKK